MVGTNTNPSHPQHAQIMIDLSPPALQEYFIPIRRSMWLTAFGVLELLLSLVLLALSIRIFIMGTFLKVSYAASACAVTHVVLAILAIVGRQKGIIIACIIIGIIGSSIISLVSIIVTSAYWRDYDQACTCEFTNILRCPLECSKIKTEELFLPVFVITLLVYAVGIIVSSISCCNICHCCGCCYSGPSSEDVNLNYSTVAIYPNNQAQLPRYTANVRHLKNGA